LFLWIDLKPLPANQKRDWAGGKADPHCPEPEDRPVGSCQGAMCIRQIRISSSRTGRAGSGFGICSVCRGAMATETCTCFDACPRSCPVLLA
jgi:hypothetical protein